MVPVINRKETGIKLRKIMDEKGFAVKDIQNYLELGSVQGVYQPKTLQEKRLYTYYVKLNKRVA